MLDSMNAGRYEGVVTTIQEYLHCALGCPKDDHEMKLNPIQLKVYDLDIIQYHVCNENHLLLY